jgi:hypothetical protein
MLDTLSPGTSVRLGMRAPAPKVTWYGLIADLVVVPAGRFGV